MISSIQSLTQSFSQRNSLKLSRPSEKQITSLLCSIEGKPYELKNYRQLLQKKQQFQKEQYIKISQQVSNVLQKDKEMKLQQLNSQILNNSASRQNTDQQQLCKICYEQLNNKAVLCHICNSSICKKCIYRTRQFKNSIQINYCQVCDTKYLQATINKQFLKSFELYKNAFELLIKEQQNLQLLISNEKTKIKTQLKNNQKIKILQNDQLIENLKHEKEHWKQKILQVKNKTTWGQSMTKKLKLKHRKLLKLVKQSFGSSANGDDPSQFQWQPPKAQSEIDLQIQNLNESMITSMLQQNQQDKQQIEQVHKFKCQCIIF